VAKPFAVSLTIAALLLPWAAPPTAFAQESDDATLRRLETVWNQAHVHGDADALDRLWADDLEVAVPRMPVMNKGQVLAFARSGKMAFQKYETSDLRIRVYGDSAVVTGRLQRTRSMNSKQMDDDWRFTKVYVRKASEWKVVSFHASEAAKP
jgi:ketosteroid isomerase-like protein